MRFIDSHVHLNEQEYDVYTNSIYQTLISCDIQSFSMSVDLGSSIKNIYLKRNFFNTSELLKTFVGIHPENSGPHILLDEFEEFFICNLSWIDGIGEIGLDPSYASMNISSSLENQKLIFNSMLTLAERYHKPISIHSRKAVAEILEILPSFRIKNAMFHWYDGSKKMLRIINDMGFYISFGPYLLYSNDKQILLKETDKNLLLTETDGPVKYRYCFNEILTTPLCVISIINYMAHILRIPFKELSELLCKNGRKFFE